MTLTTSELIKLLLRKSLRMIVDFDKTRAGKHGARPEVGFSTHAKTPSKLTKNNNLASTQWQWHAKGVRREEPVEVQVVHRKKSKARKLLFSLWLYTRRIEAVAVRLNKLVWIGCKIQYAGRSSSRRGM